MVTSLSQHAGGASTLLRLDGRDALDLLHRVTTQHLRELAPGRCRMTLACDYRGRLLHRVAVAHGSDGRVWLARDDAPGEPLRDFLDRQIFRDDVHIVDLSDRFAVSLRLVEGVPSGTGTRAGVPERGDGLERNDEPERVVERDGIPERLRPDSRFAIRVSPTGHPAGARSDVAPDAARIRAGLPRHGHEIRDDFNPFEVGLGGEVHLDKGCFTGQEALLRMMTYGGVRRRLALLLGPGAPPAPGQTLRDGRNGGDLGVVTSAGSDGAGWVGLGVVRRDVVASGGELEVQLADGAVRCVAFSESRPLGLPEAAGA